MYKIYLRFVIKSTGKIKIEQFWIFDINPTDYYNQFNFLNQSTIHLIEMGIIDFQRVVFPFGKKSKLIDNILIIF